MHSDEMNFNKIEVPASFLPNLQLGQTKLYYMILFYFYIFQKYYEK